MPYVAAQGSLGEDFSVSPDYSKIYVAGNDGILRTYDSASGAPISSLTVGTNLDAIAISRDGRYAVITEHNPVSTYQSGSWLDYVTVAAIYRVDLGTSQVQSINHTLYQTGYTFADVAFVDDNTVLISQNILPGWSGRAPIWSLDLSTVTFTAHNNNFTNVDYYSGLGFAPSLTQASIGGPVLIGELGLSSAGYYLMGSDGNLLLRNASNYNQVHGYPYGVEAFGGTGSTGRIAFIVGGGLHLYDGNFGYIANVANFVPELGASPGIAFSADGKVLYAIDPVYDEIVGIRTDDLVVVQRIAIGAHDFQVSGTGNELLVAPDGLSFLVATNHGVIHVDRPTGNLPADPGHLLTGTAGPDTIVGGAGNDTISGGDGNDSIDAGRGDNFVDGGNGDDTIKALDENDVLHGGAGADVISDSGGVIAIYGEGEDDAISVIGFGISGILDSGDGDDTILLSTLAAAGLNITVRAGTGNDTVGFSASAQNFGPAAALIDLGAGNDTITAGVGDFSPKIVLGDGVDTVLQTSAATARFLDILDFATGDGGDIYDLANLVGNLSVGLDAGSSPFTGEMWTRLVQIGPDVFLQWDRLGQGLDYLPLACFRNTTLAALTNYNFDGVDIHPVTPSGLSLIAPPEGGSLSGGRWGDVLIGQGGNDELLGSFGNDTLQGNGGADTIYGGSGDNLIAGGDGNDLITSGLAGHVHADTVDGGAGDDALLIYDSIGTTSGGSGNDRIEIHGGNGPIDGGDGGDTFAIYNATGPVSGGTGDDLIEVHGAFGAIAGGDGTDTLKFVNVASSTIGVTLDLTGAWTGAPTPADPNAASIRGIEIIAGLSGTKGNDHFVLGTGHTGVPLDPIYMNAGDDYIDVGDAAAIAYGDAGNDHLLGGAGAASLLGGDGNDLIEGLDGNDFLSGDPGDDTLDGGNGDDWLFGDVGADLLVGGAGDDQLYGVAGDDTLQGGAGADMLAIGAGVDLALGGDGDDVFRIDPGWLYLGDVIDGGAGTDRLLLNFAGDFAGLSFNLTGYWNGIAGSIGGGSVSNVEAFTFDLSDWGDHIVLGADAPFGQSVDGKGGNDTITGGAANDLLIGGAGNDRLEGGSGDDTVLGGAGDDTVIFGAGVDALGGGDGNNLLLASRAGAVLHLRTGGAPNTDLVASTEIVSQFQTISAGGFANVTLVGTDNFDSIDLSGITLDGISAIRGLGGSDRITGSAGADTIDGGSGDDILAGGAGADALYGGTGNDTFYIDTAADLLFEFAGEGIDGVIASVGHYLFDSVENLTLAFGAGDIFGVGNALANVLTGNNGANLLIAGAGNDSVHGFEGTDALFGEAGADQLFGGDGIDYLVGGADGDTLDGGADADALYGESGDDVLIGGGGFVTDILVGGDGNDVLHGDSGAADYDLMDGGNGNDTYYVDTGNDLTFEAVGGGTDTVIGNLDGPNSGVYLYSNVENLELSGMTVFGVGNGLANSLAGNFLTNLLLGGAGGDTIDGMGGNDVLFGQAGNDTFVFQRGTGGDVVGDFVRGQDKIQIEGIYTSFTQMKTHFVQVGANGAIDLGDGDVIVLHAITMSQLTASDFILI